MEAVRGVFLFERVKMNVFFGVCPFSDHKIGPGVNHLKLPCFIVWGPKRGENMGGVGGGMYVN